MKKNLLSVLSVLTISVLLSTVAFAQTEREKQIVSAAGDVYVISAKAGGVSAVEGNVTVARENGKSGLLLKGDNLELGDKVSTGTSGKAEILLNPGSYLRLGENAEFEFLTTSLEDLRLKLTRGSAIFEVFASNEFKVQINTPNNKIFFIETGVYRIDIFGGNETVSVWKGRANIGEYDAKVVKGGKRAVISSRKISVNKFKRNQLDALGQWSEARAELIAKANDKLQEASLRRSLLDSYRQNGWNLNDSFGLWVYNPYIGAYCFVPFGSRWRSPYGYGFGYDAWGYGNNYPWHSGGWGNYPQNPPSTGNPPPTTTPTAPGNPPPSAANLERSERLRTPAFQRMPEENRGSGRGNDSDSSGSGSSGSSPSSDSGNNNRPTRSESPTYNPPPSSDTKTYSPPPSSPPIIVNAPSNDSDTKKP